LRATITCSNTRKANDFFPIFITGSRCPGGWQQLGESCIRVIYNALPVDQATTVCQNMGGDLAHISSLAAYDAFVEMSNYGMAAASTKKLWIGVKKLQNSKTLMWNSLQMTISNWVSISFFFWGGGLRQKNFCYPS